MLLVDDEAVLSELPSKEEALLASSLGAADLSVIDEAILVSCRPRSLKVARVVMDAIRRTDRSTGSAVVSLYLRRLIALAQAGKLEVFGDARRPRVSEVALK